MTKPDRDPAADLLPPASTVPPAAARERGLLALGVTPAALAAAPQITPHLRAIAATIRGAGIPRPRPRRGADRVWDDLALPPPRPPATAYGPGSDLLRAWPTYLSQADDDAARRVLAAYRSVPRYAQAHVPIEAFCLAAGCSPTHILEQLTIVLMRLGTQASAIIAAVNQPRVVQRTVEMALTDEGFADRELFHKATGFLPAPKSAQTSIHVTQHAAVSAVAQAASAPAPPPESTIRRLSDRYNDAKTLTQVPVAPELPAPVASADDAALDYEDDDA